MSQMNSTAALLASVQKQFQEANANQGYGLLGPWPGEPNSGEHNLRLVSITVKEAKFGFAGGQDGKTRMERPAVEVYFGYSAEDLPDTDPAKNFRGASVYITNDTGLPPNQQTRVRISMERLKGSLKGLLGAEPTDLAASLALVQQKIEAAAAANSFILIKAWLQIKTRTVAGAAGTTPSLYTDKEDFIREVTMAPA